MAAKRHKWGPEYRMRSECVKCGCIRDRKQLVPYYELRDGTTVKKQAPECDEYLLNQTNAS